MAFPIRFLIDECLSPELAEQAHDDKIQATHVNFRGLTESGDPTIAKWCFKHDYALVTNNAKDFRAIYARLEIHPGLVILLPNVDLPGQIRLFRIVIEAIAEMPDLINKLIEIDIYGNVSVTDFPAREV